ncbi:MAG TPA: type II CAAX endopeptidase family protein [Anaerolineales bacterium]|nr:type II CAAX endopeptidase family protein [Anaerolineales bacterium]
MTETESTHPRSCLAAIFISPSEPRLRAGWRLLIQTFLFLIIGFGATLVTLLLPVKSVFDSLLWLGESAELVAVLGSVYLARRFLDRRSFISIGFKMDSRIPFDILAGILITFIMMGGIFVAMRALGWLKFESFAWNDDPLQVVALQTLSFFTFFIVVGFNEELLFRGYHLQTITSGLNLYWGLFLSSVIFGGLHLGNPNATWISAAGIFFAGIFLAYGYIRTQQLWLPIGLHLGWNFFEGIVFGFPVSGLNVYPLMHIRVSGPETWTGGAFGPEAGLIVLPALALGAILIDAYGRARSRS